MLEYWAKPENLRAALLPRERYRPFAGTGEACHLLPSQKAAMIALGESYLGYDWPTPLAADYRKFVTELTRQPYEQRNYAFRRNALNALLDAEYAEGRGRFLTDILNGLWAIMDEATWVVPAHNIAGKLYRPEPDGALWVMQDGEAMSLPDCGGVMLVDLFSAGTAGLVSDACWLLRDQLDAISPLVVKRAEAELDRRILTPFLDHLYWWSGLIGREPNNWNPWILSNVLTVFGLMCRDEELRARGIAKCCQLLEQFLKVYQPDGGCDEGPSYWTAAGASLFDCLSQLDALTGGAFAVYYSHPLVRNIALYICRAHIGGAYYTNYADAGLNARVCCDLINRFGRAIGDRAMERLGAAQDALYRRRDGTELAPMHAHTPHMHYRQMQAAGNLRRLTETEGAFPLYESVYLENLQYMAERMKTGTDQGLYLSAKGGNNGESHNHNDVGTFLLYSDACPTVVDLGSGQYNALTFSDQRYTILQMQSAYHNLPLVNGVMERDGRQYAGRDAHYEKADGVTSWSLELAGAYPPEAGLRFWRRSFTFDRRAAQVTVTDRAAFEDGENRVELMLMLPEKPEITGLTAVLTPMGAGRRVLLTASAGTLTAEAVDVSGDPGLLAVWGDTVYRLHIALQCQESLDSTLEFTQLS